MATAPPKSITSPTDKEHKFTVLDPQFTLKWSRDWVIPKNVLQPGDVVAEMVVDATIPKNKAKSPLRVTKAWNGKSVAKVEVPEVSLKAGQVVQADGKRPPQQFTLDNEIYDPYDKLRYDFYCTISGVEKKVPKSLLVRRWHVQALDNSDNNAANPNNIYQAFRLTEGANFRGAFTSGDDLAHTWTFNANSTGFAGFGEKMTNSYTFVYTGHGAVMCRTCLAMWDGLPANPLTPAQVAAGIPQPTGSDAEFGRWTCCSTVGCSGSPRSTHCIGGWQPAGSASFMDSTHVADSAVCPTTPKYLMFSVCCGGAFETSLYDAYIGRGTKYAVGFKKSTRCDWARDYAKSFFDTWAQTHNCNPDKIPDVFSGLQSTWETKLEPSIFGKYLGLGSKVRNLGRKLADLF
ncbi:hypothetical protein [Aquabacterium sp.]|uniref:hypothetical protein n=1 Tax=Aquabacterium sp. TaxID=1872578 RepID=UPI003784FAB1